MLGDKSITDFRSFDCGIEIAEMYVTTIPARLCPVTARCLVDPNEPRSVIRLLPAVLDLNCLSNKASVAWEISVVVIPAVACQMVDIPCRLSPLLKCLKGTPLRAHLDATAAVVLVEAVSWISASLDYMHPDVVQAGIPRPMSCIGFSGPLFLVASARLCAPSS